MREARGWFIGVAGLVLTLGGGVVSSPALAAQEREAATIVYLVRHAEKADDDPTDPSLTPEGRARADELVRVLSDAGITHVYSTPYRRTRSTVAPLAEALGLEVRSYDPRDPDFLELLRTTRGRIVVSGHSNTTPEMVRALGGDPVAEIPDWEYDRLYLVVLGSDGTVTSTLLRYGDPSIGG